MNTTYNSPRRAARARALVSTFPPSLNTFHVDPAANRHRQAFTVAVVSFPTTTHTYLTIPTTTPRVAEEVAIALALAHQPPHDLILSDSKTAIKYFASGTISSLASKILLKNSPPEQPTELVW